MQRDTDKLHALLRLRTKNLHIIRSGYYLGSYKIYMKEKKCFEISANGKT